MMRGRKPLATAEKERRGSFTPHPERRNKREPKPPSGRPTKPKHLDEYASKKWNAVVKLLDQMGLLNKADADLLELYCVTYSGYRRALESVAKTGMVLVTREDHGEQVEVRRNPFSVELHKYMDRMQKLLSEMGLSPVSRSRVQAAGSPEESNPVLEMLRQRQGAN